MSKLADELRKSADDLESYLGKIPSCLECGETPGRLRAVAAELDRLEAELARVQRLPTLDWAQAKAAFLLQLARLARSGEQPAAQACVDRGNGGASQRPGG